MVRMLRVLRIAKLFRILRASRIYNRWIDYVGISYALQALVKFLVLHSNRDHTLCPHSPLRPARV